MSFPKGTKVRDRNGDIWTYGEDGLTPALWVCGFRAYGLRVTLERALGPLSCPGCGDHSANMILGDCCEYENLRSGRSHYCGQDSCYCHNLRAMIRRDVLDSFIPVVTS